MSGNDRDPCAPPAVSVVVPTYREADNIPMLVPRIHQALVGADLPAEIILVDDDSRDGTVEAVAALAARQLPVRLEVRTAERGLSSAVLHGFRQARGEFLVCMDADLSHPPEKIAELIAPLHSGEADFTIGSRYVAGASTDASWGLFRWLNSKVATLLARPLVRVKDPMSGFFALRRDRFEAAAELSPIGYKIGLELLVKTGARKTVEVPIHFADRVAGESKLNLSEQLKYLAHLQRLLHYERRRLSRLLRFCCVGGTGVVVDLLTLNVLLVLTGHFRVSRAVAILVAMTWNFVLNRRYTFGHARGGGWLAQYLRFVATCLLGGLINWWVSSLLVTCRPGSVLWVQASALAGIVCGTLSNFLFANYLVFPEPPTSASPPASQAKHQG